MRRMLITRPPRGRRRLYTKIGITGEGISISPGVHNKMHNPRYIALSVDGKDLIIEPDELRSAPNIFGIRRINKTGRIVFHTPHITFFCKKGQYIYVDGINGGIILKGAVR